MSKIVFIGDSLTKGIGYGGVTATDTFAYKIGIANGYAPADILNKGVSSDTAFGVLNRIQADAVHLSQAGHGYVADVALRSRHTGLFT